MAKHKTDNEYELTKELISTGSDVSGAAAGAAIGLIGGPVGAVAGAASGAVIARILRKVGSDIQKRFFSPREHIRVGAVAGYAGACIQEMLDNGVRLREDDFFAETANGRSNADEILEGIILTARDEYEEKKLPYLGQLYASIAFSPGISKSYANALVKLANELSYTQFVALSVAAYNPENSNKLRQTPYTNGQSNVTLNTNTVALLSEIYWLGIRDLITDGSVWLGITYINPSRIKAEGAGNMLVKLMRLKNIPDDDRAQFYEYLGA